MIIFPAIDLLDKKVVRLLKGDYKQVTVYNDNPVEVIKEFEKCGAKWVHLVDLNGAKLGTTSNLDVVSQIVQNTQIKVEIGGGIRNIETIEKYFDIGVSRVILGTAAVKDPELLRASVKKYGDKIAVGADVKDGVIAINGWTECSKITLDDFMSDMQKIGVKYVICTDISKDGAMSGTNLNLYKNLSIKYNLSITASGGVSTIYDIKQLREMNLYGAIIGKAYYTGAINLKEAIEVAK